MLALQQQWCYSVSKCFVMFQETAMPLIAFLAPDEDMLATARATLAKTHPDVLLEQGLLSAGVRKARTLAREGVEIVITRGGTAAAINEAQLGLTVVEVPITGTGHDPRPGGGQALRPPYRRHRLSVDDHGHRLPGADPRYRLEMLPHPQRIQGRGKRDQGLPGRGGGHHRRRNHHAGRPQASIIPA